MREQVKNKRRPIRVILFVPSVKPITEPVFVNLLRSPAMTYRPARLRRLAKPIPWNRFLGPLNVYKYGLRTMREEAKNNATL
jgi:hypothetical protein